jgi:class 3 adenylate cyclase/tetratricopeptide (TPR) repeat protein
MKCSGCETENPEQAKFCIECGAKLEFHCPSCGAVTPATGKFCMECGHSLKKEEPSKPVNYDQPHSYTPKHLADKILTHRSAIEGERKLVTVLFADVANFTAMSEKLDPEEVHQIMDGCFKILMDEIHQCEGTINQFTGDGIMALFGAPVAHEDHAQRACRAALAIQKAMGDYGQGIEQRYDVLFQMRIGLNSGPVIVGAIGDDLRMDYTAVGDTTNLAARVEQHTEPGKVYLSRETRNTVRDYFQSEPVAEMTFKGKSKPQTIYRLISEYAHVRNRFDAGLVRGVTELVGRKREIVELRTQFQKAASGEAQIVDVVGEAGIGKSRLVYEFRESLGEEALFLTGLCMQYGGNINFLPVIDIVKAVFGIEQDMTDEEASRCIEEKATGELNAMIPFYRSLLSLKVEDPKFNALQPEGRKFGTFEAVKEVLILLSKGKPVVVFAEDVHWIDKISEEFFTFFSRCISEHPILLLSAYRPEGAPPWAQGMHYHRLGLETLSPKSSVHLVHNILGGLSLEPALENRIVEKTKGNPFFVEEIVRELLERGDIGRSGDEYISTQPIAQLQIPNTVQAVLAARMDRLSDDLKRTMQVASVIGRDFAFKILKSILELGDELRGHLTNLVGLEILYEKALFPELEYIFKHALTQEVAYESLLKERRRAIHARIAQAIEEIYADRLDEHYELLAHHYSSSGDAEKAVQYLMLAGEKSNQQNAVRVAQQFFEKALNLVNNKSTRINNETEVRLYYGLALANNGLGDNFEAVQTARIAVQLSRKHGMTEYEKRSLFLFVWFMHYWPERTEAEMAYKEGILRAKELKDKGLETQVLSRKALNEGCFFSPIEANQIALDSEQIATEANDQFSLNFARFMRSILVRWIGKPKKAIELNEGMIESMGKVFNFNLSSNVILFRAIPLAEIGKIEEAISILEYGIDISNKWGPFWRHASFLNTLAYCYGELRQYQNAWELNLKSEETALMMLDKYPAGLQYAEIAAHAGVNLVENLFDQGKMDAAWNRMNTIEERANSKIFDCVRSLWESRMQYIRAQILLFRNESEKAENLIRVNLRKSRNLGLKKREGCFLKTLGEVHLQRNESDIAVENIGQAIDILKSVGNPRKLWEAHASLATAYEKNGQAL